MTAARPLRSDRGARKLPQPDRAGATVPLVWVLTGDKAGDRGQLLVLARALGWPFEEKRLAYNAWQVLPAILVGATRLSLDRRGSSPLRPPWPDLVIAGGRRAVPVARWLRARAGGGCRLVHVGRPWAPLALFDLVVTTAQYALPARPNVLHNTLALNRPDPDRLDAAAAAWEPRLKELPRPWIGLIVGGAARPYCLDAGAAARLGREASALAAKAGGSLLVTTSRRTPPAAVDALFAAISVPAFRHRWSGDGDNPYLAYLALADRFVVTGDSASMLSETCATGKPVFVFDLPERPDWRLRAQRSLRACAKAGRTARLYARLVDLGLLTSTRDMAAFRQVLFDRGLAAPLGGNAAPAAAAIPDDLDRAARRVRALVQ